MGETGPCGPCTEIFYDRTPDKTGGPTVLSGTDPRVMEIWNNVFIQYNRNADRSLTKLPAQHVDTGMGFERICQVIQGKTDNYAIDLFEPVFTKISLISAKNYGGLFPENDLGDRSSESPELKRDIAFRVIADHARMATFSITDGANPGPNGRDSVVRSVIRRAVRFGYQQFNLRRPFLFELVDIFAHTMGDAFPELRTSAKRVAEIIRSEEASFLQTIERGLGLFDDAANRAVSKLIPAKDSFDLHTTFGFPIDLQEQMALERGLRIDGAGYEKLFDEFREKSGEGRKSYVILAVDLTGVRPTNDKPKFASLIGKAKILAAVRAAEVLTSGTLLPRQQVALILDSTNFYGEQGGQVGDSGFIATSTGAFIVQSTQRAGDHVLHVGIVNEGSIEIGQTADLSVDPTRRQTEQNHTTTHVTNWALREVQGDGVQQKGSLVDDTKLRFDFSHNQSLSDDEAARVQQLVNDAIAKVLKVSAKEVPLEQAMKISGLRAVFGEKYPPLVRVVSVGAEVDELLADAANPKWRQFSVEFCGGTHVPSLESVGEFVLISDEPVSKGVRRIVGVTGEAADASLKSALQIEIELDAAGKIEPKLLPASISALQKQIASPGVPLLSRRRGNAVIAELQQKHRTFEKGQKKALAASVDVAQVAAGIFEQAKSSGATKIVTGIVEGGSSDVLLGVMDSVRKAGASYALLLAGIEGEKLSFLAAVSDDVIARGLKAGEWIRDVAKVAGGGGGGRPNMAQAGGKDVSKAADAVALARDIAAKVLG